jgi:hypothetical protein
VTQGFDLLLAWAQFLALVALLGYLVVRGGKDQV